MKKILISVLSFSIFSTMLFAQSENLSSFYTIGGIQFMDFKKMNDKLGSNHLPKINRNQYYYGIGGNTLFGKVVLGGEGYQFYSIETNKGNRQLKSQGGQGYLYLGYKIIEKEKFYFIPRIGFGGGGMEIQINLGTTESLDSFLINNHSNNLSIGNLIAHSGLKFGFIMGENIDFNFDLGYNYGFANEWNNAKGSLTESVSDKLGGLFSQISIAYRFD